MGAKKKYMVLLLTKHTNQVGVQWINGVYAYLNALPLHKPAHELAKKRNKNKKNWEKNKQVRKASEVGVRRIKMGKLSFERRITAKIASSNSNELVGGCLLPAVTYRHRAGQTEKTRVAEKQCKVHATLMRTGCRQEILSQVRMFRLVFPRTKITVCADLILFQKAASPTLCIIHVRKKFVLLLFFLAGAILCRI